MSNLTRRGPNANTPAKMPGIDTSRVADRNIRQALDALREWVEVRLGARGDFYERAVTQREYDPTVKDFEARIAALESEYEKLVDQAEASGSTNTSVLNPSSSESLLIATRNSLQRQIDDLTAQIAGMSGTSTGTGYAQVENGVPVAALTTENARLDLQDDGLTVEAVGFRGWPTRVKSENYTLVAADSGRMIVHPSTDAASRWFTIPANSSVAFPLGTTVAFANETSQPVRISSTDSIHLPGTETPSEVGIGINNVAIATKVAATKWIVTGTGLASGGSAVSAGSATVLAQAFAVTGDAHRTSRVIVLHAEDGNGSTTFANSAPNTYTATSVGGCAVTTSASAFGTGSISFDGTNNYLYFNYTSGVWEPTGAWEVECRYKPSVTPTNGTGSSSIQMLYARWISDSERTFFGYGHFNTVQSTPGLWLQINTGGNSVTAIADVTLSTSVFSHIKLTYDGATYRIFVDGALLKEEPSNVKHSSTFATFLHVGYGWASSFYANGLIDEYIFTSGVTTSTAAFTSPAAALDDFVRYGAAGTSAGAASVSGVPGHSGYSVGFSQAAAIGTTV